MKDVVVPSKEAPGSTAVTATSDFIMSILEYVNFSSLRE